MTNRSTATPEVPSLAQVKRTAAPLREQVQTRLRDAIISGRLAPGARLIERELIAMLGVSRTVVREALRQIETEGLVAEDTRKGLVVRELTATEARHLYAIRARLEGLAARLFVEAADDAQVKALAEALDETARAYAGGDPQRILHTKNGFYRRLFEGAGSETLSQMLSVLHARIWRWRALGLTHPRRSDARSRESVRGLRALLAAIRARDPERAEAVMRDETTRAANEVLRLLEPGAKSARTAPPRARSRQRIAA